MLDDIVVCNGVGGDGIGGEAIGRDVVESVLVDNTVLGGGVVDAVISGGSNIRSSGSIGSSSGTVGTTPWLWLFTFIASVGLWSTICGDSVLVWFDTDVEL